MWPAAFATNGSYFGFFTTNGQFIFITVNRKSWKSSLFENVTIDFHCWEGKKVYLITVINMYLTSQGHSWMIMIYYYN